MANFNMFPYSNTQTTPPGLASGDAGYGGIQKALTAQLTYAAQASGSTLTIGTVPAGSFFLGGDIYTDTSTGSATLAIGGSQAPASIGTFQSNCYKAAAAITTVDSSIGFYSNVGATHPYLLGNPVPYGAAETFIITTGGAGLPASGNLMVFIYYM